MRDPLAIVTSLVDDLGEKVREGKAKEAQFTAKFLHTVIDKALDGVPLKEALESTMRETEKRVTALGSSTDQNGSSSQRAEEEEEDTGGDSKLGPVILAVAGEVGVGALTWIVGFGAATLIFGSKL